MRKILFPALFAAVAVLAGGCGAAEKPAAGIDNAQTWSDAAKQFETAVVAVRAAQAEKPYQGDLRYISPRTINDDGSLRMVTYRDWTCGFFPGSLWYTYEHFGTAQWLDLAREYTELMEDAQYRTNTHDVGFLMYCSYGNGYRLTGNEKYRDVLVQSANSLITRYREEVGAIRSWDHSTDKWDYPVIIDNMMNLELLFWASKETGDPVYREIAVAHADKTLANHFRPDYSSYHVVGYDPVTGEALHHHTHQGLAHETAWARGQAWALYGYTLCYRETEDKRYLDQAHGVARFIFNHPNLPEDGIPYWDFNDPAIPDAPRDASAGMIIASALYELSTYPGDKDYRLLADRMMNSVVNHYRAAIGEDYGFLLLHSTGNYPKDDEIDAPINYADYYYLEALTRKTRLDNGKPVL